MMLSEAVPDRQKLLSVSVALGKEHSNMLNSWATIKDSLDEKYHPTFQANPSWDQEWNEGSYVGV